MLYDPKQEYDPVFQGVSRRKLIAWLETMPPNQQYEYLFPLECVVAQFLESKGASPENRIVDFGAAIREPDPRGVWLNDIVSRRPYTYGAALERARAARNVA